MKNEKLGEAQKFFVKTGITIKAVRVLDSVIGIESECIKFLEFQQNEQIKILKILTKIVKTSPQNVYACYTKGVQKKLSFLARTTPNNMEYRKKRNLVNSLNETDKYAIDLASQQFSRTVVINLLNRNYDDGDSWTFEKFSKFLQVLPATQP